ncbi:hypothetical protein VNO77_03243 [Canavalia gladiata]|uniref:Uncharacterized protein n=1 Tax=Canavalia gladiata TaxID=3824 RepID=A0AAN9MWE3_CANGL
MGPFYMTLIKLHALELGPPEHQGLGALSQDLFYLGSAWQGLKENNRNETLHDRAKCPPTGERSSMQRQEYAGPRSGYRKELNSTLFCEAERVDSLNFLIEFRMVRFNPLSVTTPSSSYPFVPLNFLIPLLILLDPDAAVENPPLHNIVHNTTTDLPGTKANGLEFLYTFSDRRSIERYSLEESKHSVMTRDLKHVVISIAVIVAKPSASH